MRQIIFFAHALLLLSCNQTKVDKKAEGEKVMQLSKEWSQAASAGDVEKIVSYWAEDAVVMSAGQPVLNGKQAIRKMVDDSYKMPGFRISWQPQSVVVSESGDMAYLIENSQISFTDSTGKPITTNNKAVSIWRKQGDGSWKNAVDISTPETIHDN
ncbi:MAG TPA: SgcJ/EcaC family oxidoreductase [Chitinophagaceae bacterium]|nr:SgcJ/EcaC family oxidoreductase [Chitinophagaceae bacterium]